MPRLPMEVQHTGQLEKRPVAYTPVPGIILWQTSVQASSQWTELIAASLAILEGKAHHVTYTLTVGL